jgi:hypothetical protein
VRCRERHKIKRKKKKRASKASREVHGCTEREREAKGESKKEEKRRHTVEWAVHGVAYDN